jgi:hypothetical protein
MLSVKRHGEVMSHRNILIIILKLASIFLIIQVLETLPVQYGSHLNTDDPYLRSAFFSTVLFPNLIKIAVALVLWFFPNSLIKSVIPDTELTSEHSDFYKNLDVAVLTGVGIYLMAFSIADVTYYFVLKNELSQQFGSSLEPQDHAALVASVIQLVIGAVIIFGNKGIAALIVKARQ